MKKLLIAVVVMLATCPAALAINRHDAYLEVDQALRAEFGADYDSGQAGRPDCRRRDDGWKCKVAWAQGDSGYTGVVRVDEDGDTKLRIKHIDEYCLYVRHKPRSKCVETIRA